MRQRVCMTGAGHKTRPELTKELEEMGYQVVNHVDSSVHMLICEDKTRNTIKLQNARRLGVKIVNYNEVF